MVQNTRKTPSPSALRPLNLPVPITVEEDARHRPLAISPLALSKKGRQLKMAPVQVASVKVASVDNLWKIDEEWWRDKPILRMYYQVTTEGGQRLTLFRDLTSGEWYQQRG